MPPNIDLTEKDDNWGMAHSFLIDCGLEPTPDTVDQLVDVFLPCLRIMSKRGYDPEGGTWRAAGWRGQLYEMRKNVERIWQRSWFGNRGFQDAGLDLINYTGFYIRGLSGPAWGTWGEPALPDNSGEE